MRKLIDLGKIDYNNIGKKTCPVTIELVLRKTEGGVDEFTASGEIWNHRRTSVYECSQCLDTIKYYCSDNPLFMEIYEFWKKYHLNTLHAGMEEQEEALKNRHFSYYEDKIEYLKSIGLYEVDYNGKPYRYGSGWIPRIIPNTDLNRITEIIKE